jgi:hypothetical protein
VLLRADALAFPRANSIGSSWIPQRDETRCTLATSTRAANGLGTNRQASIGPDRQIELSRSLSTSDMQYSWFESYLTSHRLQGLKHRAQDHVALIAPSGLALAHLRPFVRVEFGDNSDCVAKCCCHIFKSRAVAAAQSPNVLRGCDAAAKS